MSLLSALLPWELLQSQPLFVLYCGTILTQWSLPPWLRSYTPHIFTSLHPPPSHCIHSHVTFTLLQICPLVSSREMRILLSEIFGGERKNKGRLILIGAQQHYIYDDFDSWLIKIWLKKINNSHQNVIPFPTNINSLGQTEARSRR